MLKIRQSYHGDGGREGYRFEVYNNEYDCIGELVDLPLDCICGAIISINEELYKMVESYDSDLPYEEVDEVIYHILEKVKPNYILKLK